MRNLNTQNMENRINEMAIEAIHSAKMEASYYGREVTLEGFLNEVNCVLMACEFENEATKAMIDTAIKLESERVDPVFYNLVYPKIRIDQDGNYTKDSTKWA
jgi:hypothetical protein